MTHKAALVSRSAKSFGVAATSSGLREEGRRPAKAVDAAKRVVHTSLIDAEWDMHTVTRESHQSGARRMIQRSPQTSLIDAGWDVEADTGGTDVRGDFARPPQTTLLGLGEELDPVITYFELDGPECLFD